MGGTETRGPIRRWFAGLGFSQMGQLLTVAILGATALFGGLDTVSTTVTPFQPGDQFSDGPFTVTVDRASFPREIRAGTWLVAPKAEGLRYLAVVATLHNDGTVPASVDDELDLRDEPNKRFFGVFRIADGSRITRIGPGLSEEVATLWTLPEDALRDGDSVTLRVWKKEFHELMVTYGQTWLDSLTEYGQVSVPVKVAP
ncbi:hypothetical protein FHT40_006592 [Mycolicibacterium sp. BK556]|uniref:hypothetical protein n=1 Tax=unclassified Mycolicibacterium TaxID=2636767 RepID=UPI00179657E6|nr:hypothetical protein [Mycolicibacterium sp. BK556]MBB3636435.1 hypothetical protein [Mycolicibacterium sp. BK607]